MATAKKIKYYEAVGRRKTSSARVRLIPAEKNSLTVNGRDFKKYFPTEEMRHVVMEALARAKPAEKFAVTVKISGGGLHSQAEAVRHGLARALTVWDTELRGKLKKAGFLKRDPRMKERRKFGLKKARKSPKWSKR